MIRREGQPMRPLDYTVDGPRFAAYRRGDVIPGLTGWHWQATHGEQLIMGGDARTRLGLEIALWRARLRLAPPTRRRDRAISSLLLYGILTSVTAWIVMLLLGQGEGYWEWLTFFVFGTLFFRGVWAEIRYIWADVA
jgi:hypothetical protein